jgi:L-ribulose-5-phosphate 3-epimerase
MKQNRREFIAKVTAAGIAAPFISDLKHIVSFTPQKKIEVRLFSKPLDQYDFGFMCECLLNSGIGGFDLTVRPGGKVEPGQVETQLPKLVEQAGKKNLALDMMVTAILSAGDAFTDRVLKTASETGIKYYRLGWYDYDLKAGILESLARHREELLNIAELNRKYNLHGGYQNHSGSRVGGPVWDLHELLRGIPSEYLGSQYDVRHAMVEGTNTWIFGMRLIAPHIKTLAIKDFTWKTINDKPQAVTVPLGEGMVDWDLFFKTVREFNLTGPATLHVEYPLLEDGEDKLSLDRQQEIIVRKLRKDVDFLNNYLAKYQLA